MQNLRRDLDHLAPRERRGAPRFPAVDNTAELGWYANEELNTTAAQLMDVSQNGLLVLADDAPNGEGAVLVRLLQPVATEWVEANLVEATRTRFGPYQIRLSFPETPSPDFLVIALSRTTEDV